MIMYLLALGHPNPNKTVPASDWTHWTGTYFFGSWYGYQYLIFAPLFGHQYSHCWIDFRHIRDPYMQARGIDYFENSRRATMAQIEYCSFNPAGWVGYSDSLWGVTACDGPSGYSARGVPPPQNEDGTIAPTAAAGSLPFTHTQSLAVLHKLWDSYRAQLWGPYGFRDAFNLTQNWWDTDYIGIDQGPIVLMIENYRTGAVWNRFMQHPYVQAGLAKAGFVAATTDAEPAGVRAISDIVGSIEPNPSRIGGTLRFRIPSAAHVRVELMDIEGRRIRELLDEPLEAGEHTLPVSTARLSAGVYLVRVDAGGFVRSFKTVRVP
jgi:hypothetical protein